jgi:hypothetical protein
MTFSRSDWEARIGAASTAAFNWLAEWGSDLAATAQTYTEAQASGRHGGRRIPADMAATFATDFSYRADAVLKAGDAVKAALDRVRQSGPLNHDEDPYARAENVAGNTIDRLTSDLNDLFEKYIEARRSGYFENQPIEPETARIRAAEFRQRCEAVSDCEKHVRAAIQDAAAHPIDPDYEKLCREAGWKGNEGDCIWDSKVFSSWKEAVSWSGEEDAGPEAMSSTTYTTWQQCWESELAAKADLAAPGSGDLAEQNGPM